MPSTTHKPRRAEPELPPSITTPDPAPAVTLPPAVVTTDSALVERQVVAAARDGMVQALLLERASLERAGKTDRMKQVDEQLRLRGYPTE
jgi:hypothetical protein